MAEETRYLLDGETEINTVYLADDAVENFLEEGLSYDIAYRADELGLGPFYSQQSLERINGENWKISFREIEKIADGYDERPMKRPEWYAGEQRWLDQVEVAKFPGSRDSNVLMISENDDVNELVDRKDYMLAMSPEEALEALNP